MTLNENKKECFCAYGHRFIASTVKLIPFKNETKEKIGEVLFIGTDGQSAFRAGCPTDGFLLACPVCGVVHLGAFQMAEGLELAPVISSQTPERNIALVL